MMLACIRMRYQCHLGDACGHAAAAAAANTPMAAGLRACVLRIELCSSSGQQLRSFGLDECNGAPHEFRGVDRSALLQALRDKLPEGTVQYDSPVSGVSFAEDGALATACLSVSSVGPGCYCWAAMQNSTTQQLLDAQIVDASVPSSYVHSPQHANGQTLAGQSTAGP